MNDLHFSGALAGAGTPGVGDEAGAGGLETGGALAAGSGTAGVFDASLAGAAGAVLAASSRIVFG